MKKTILPFWQQIKFRKQSRQQTKHEQIKKRIHQHSFTFNIHT